MGSKFESVDIDSVPYWSDEQLMDMPTRTREWMTAYFERTNHWSRHAWADAWINSAHPDNAKNPGQHSL